MVQDANYLINETKNYSAAEIKLLCKEAWIIQSAPTWKRLENNEITVTNLQFNITCLSYLISAMEDMCITYKDISKFDEWITSLVC